MLMFVGMEARTRFWRICSSTSCCIM